jgi:hypothetical protein
MGDDSQHRYLSSQGRVSFIGKEARKPRRTKRPHRDGSLTWTRPQGNVRGARCGCSRSRCFDLATRCVEKWANWSKHESTTQARRRCCQSIELEKDLIHASRIHRGRGHAAKALPYLPELKKFRSIRTVFRSRRTQNMRLF